MRGCAVLLGVVLAALAAGATGARATHYVVEQGGGGDFTTIQAAIDQRAIEFRDTILVMPGDYPEAMVLPAATQSAWIVGAEGASVTRAWTIVPPPSTDYVTRIEGLAFTQAVVSTVDPRSHYFFRCQFLGSVSSYGDSRPANFNDCDFHGRTRFYGYHGSLRPGSTSPPFENLRFHGTTLVITPYANGDNAMRNCSFEGPSDTLVYKTKEYDPVDFEACRFSNARYGIVYGMGDGGPEYVSRCSFTDLLETGVHLDADVSGYPEHDAGIQVLDSRFERCGTGLRWVVRKGQGSHGAELVRDTVLASRHDGIVLGRQLQGGIFESIVEGSGGHGVVFQQDRTDDYYPFRAIVSASTISNSAGDGLHVDASGDLSSLMTPSPSYPAHVITNCTFSRNGGAGLRLVGPRWDVRHCTAIDNGGEGFACSTTVAVASSQLVSNTSVLNRSEGFLVQGPEAPLDTLQFVRNNLAAMNARVGFRVPHQASGSFAFNDAWGNYLAQYVGAWGSLDSNLTVDPRFCDLGAGDLGLQQGSPCGAGGVYGLIGALPESCPNTTAVEPPAPGSLAFAVRPSIARGSVEFVPPASGAEGRVELFDVAGRVVWRAPLGPASGVVRWRGEGETGHVRAGLYWARFTRGSERATQRLVWLE